MRTIRVRNASVLADLDGREIDFEIRTSKNSKQGFTFLVDGKKWLDIDLVDGKLVDGSNFGGETLLSIKEVGQAPTPNSSAGTDERKPLRLDLPDNLIPKDGGYILIHDKPRITVMRLRCDMDDDFPIKAKMAIGDYVIALNEYTGPNTHPDIGEHIRNDLLDFQSKWNKEFGLEEAVE